ncbi:N2227-like protein-domain-containing protein [Phascolomyces articulosus]|uniref:carnosine N-methyltransferase n=1 Tax=Phascolomyces articulosus TaxID=60185 RepID=A0AAD5PIN3_9FUNG|nr:N2227-like protein-domain-containing protein [Phascolomyces articulosus]
MATHEHSHTHSHSHDHGHEYGPEQEHDHDHDDEQLDPAEAERIHLRTVLTAFTYYKAHSRNKNHRRRHDFLALPEHHKRLIPDVLEKIDKVDRCVEKNMIMLRDIVKCAGMFMGIDPRALVAEGSQMKVKINKRLFLIYGDKPPVTPMDMDKVRSTLKQFVRDWAEEGKAERDATYGPILEELENIYGDVDVKDRGNIRILVPGAGLGRLAYDIASKGFSCQGKIKLISKPAEYEIYPFIHSFSNIRASEQQLKPIRIPDIVPSQLPATADFSMAAGEFVEVYGGDEDGYGTWDVVVTCFFIDTATNIISYLEVIHNILKEGGTWINIGPLLYHFEDIPGEGSIELSLEEVKRVSRDIGFEFKNEKTINTTYTSNPDGMLKYVYECAFWSATKKSK